MAIESDPNDPNFGLENDVSSPNFGLAVAEPPKQESAHPILAGIASGIWGAIPHTLSQVAGLVGAGGESDIQQLARTGRMIGDIFGGATPEESVRKEAPEVAQQQDVLLGKYGTKEQVAGITGLGLQAGLLALPFHAKLRSIAFGETPKTVAPEVAPEAPLASEAVAADTVATPPVPEAVVPEPAPLSTEIKPTEGVPNAEQITETTRPDVNVQLPGGAVEGEVAGGAVPTDVGGEGVPTGGQGQEVPQEVAAVPSRQDLIDQEVKRYQADYLDTAKRFDEHAAEATDPEVKAEMQKIADRHRAEAERASTPEFIQAFIEPKLPEPAPPAAAEPAAAPAQAPAGAGEAVLPHERPDFERGSIHINVRGNELDLTKPVSGWVLPAEKGDYPNAMSTKYGKAGLTAVYVPEEFVQSRGDRPSVIKQGYIPPPENVAKIPSEAIRPSGTVDWTKVFKTEAPAGAGEAPAPEVGAPVAPKEAAPAPLGEQAAPTEPIAEQPNTVPTPAEIQADAGGEERVGIAERYREEQQPGSVIPGVGRTADEARTWGHDFINKGGNPYDVVNQRGAKRELWQDVGVVRAEYERLSNVRRTAEDALEANPNDPQSQMALNNAELAQRQWSKDMQPVLTRAGDALRAATRSYPREINSFSDFTDIVNDHFNGELELTPEQRTQLQKAVTAIKKGNVEATEARAKVTDAAVKKAGGKTMPFEDLKTSLNQKMTKLMEECPV